MRSEMVKKMVSLVMLLSLLPAAGWALGDGQDRRPKPPPEAIEACHGKEEGDRVEFKGRQDRLIKAVCRKHQGLLVAVPEHGPRRPSGDAPEPRGIRE